MPNRIDLTECARRYGWKPNKSGRESVRRWFLETDADRAALDYDVTTGKGMVDETAFMLALARVRDQRRSTDGPAANLGAHARRGLTVTERTAVFRSEKAARQRAARTKARGGVRRGGR